MKKGAKHTQRVKRLISLIQTGVKHWNWKGGRYLCPTSGYVKVLVRHGHGRGRMRYANEHRLIMEKLIGRKLKRSEIVHHKNGIRSDNRISNLEIMSRSHHNKIHHAGKKARFHGNQWTGKIS